MGSLRAIPMSIKMQKLKYGNRKNYCYEGKGVLIGGRMGFLFFLGAFRCIIENEEGCVRPTQAI